MKTPYVCRNEKTLGTTTCHPEDVECSARRRTPNEGSMYILCMRYSKAEADAKTVQPARLYSFLPPSTPADRTIPRNRWRSPRANCKSRNPSICRANVAPYPYHQTFFTPGRRSESRYLILTISSSPNRPCVRPMPLAFTPPCGASLLPKHDTVSFTITVPA